jgi:hypothetical protein
MASGSIPPATHLLYAAAGAPPQPGTTPGGCCLCGAAGIGVPFRQWVKAAFTNYDLLHPGVVVCHACQFCALDACPALTQRTGKALPQRMRNYSHFVTADGQWLPLSKGHKAQIWLALGAQPRLAVLALSGQKHLLFRARPGWWQFEEVPLRPAPHRTTALVGSIHCLLLLGFSKAEIATGHYRQDRLLRAGLAARAHDALLRPHRGSPYFALALWLAQAPENDEEDEDGRDPVPPGDAAPGAAVARHPEQLQIPLSAHDLATVRGPSAVRRVHQ